MRRDEKFVKIGTLCGFLKLIIVNAIAEPGSYCAVMLPRMTVPENFRQAGAFAGRDFLCELVSTPCRRVQGLCDTIEIHFTVIPKKNFR